MMSDLVDQHVTNDAPQRFVVFGLSSDSNSQSIAARSDANFGIKEL